MRSLIVYILVSCAAFLQLGVTPAHATPFYSETFQPNRESLAQQALGANFRSQLKPTFYTDLLSAYQNGKQAVLVWSAGPQKGQVYDIIQLPASASLAGLPTAPDIRAQLDAQIADLVPSWNNPEVRDNKLMRIAISLHTLYEGIPTRPGLKVRRIFDPDVNRMVQEWQSRGLTDFIFQKLKSKWIPNVALKDVDLYATGLGDAGANGRPPHLADLLSNFGNYTHQASNNAMVGTAPNQIRLTHGTWSAALPGIFAERALKSGHSRSKDIPQETGENSVITATKNPGGAIPDISPDVVSFFDWSLSEFQEEIYLPIGFDAPQIFQFPVTFGVTTAAAQKIPFRKEGVDTEVVVPDQVPLENITHIFVPSAEVDNIKRILNLQGLSQIQVLPF